MILRERIAWLVSFVLLAGLALNLPRGSAIRDEDRVFAGPIVDIFRRLSDDYVTAIDPERLQEAAIDGMLGALEDPHTVYIRPRDHQQFRDSLEGEFDGVGIVIEISEQGHPTVVTPIEGSPAIRAGIRSGDQILKVNDTDVVGKPMDQIISLIKGPAGSSVRLTVRHLDGVEQTLSVPRARIADSPLKGLIRMSETDWQFIVDPDGPTAYLRLAQFTPGASQRLESALSTMLQEGVRQVILDLRNNPGGQLEEAARTVDLMIPGGVILRTGGRAKPDEIINASGSGTLGQFDLAILINSASASASEIVAGALQDHRRAVVVGQRSFGKGSVQEPVALDGGGDLKLTIRLYYLPGGRLVQRMPGAEHWGVEPDVHVPLEADALQAARLARRDAERIPPTPDFPIPSTSQLLEADPQLRAAVDVLRMIRRSAAVGSR